MKHRWHVWSAIMVSGAMATWACTASTTSKRPWNSPGTTGDLAGLGESPNWPDTHAASSEQVATSHPKVGPPLVFTIGANNDPVVTDPKNSSWEEGELPPGLEVEVLSPPDTEWLIPDRPLLPNDGHQHLVLQWPLPATGVTSLFGERTDPVHNKKRFHYGVDLQGKYGQPVLASAAGVITFSGWNGGHGRMVIVQHAGGWRTSYSHLAQLIGAVGSKVYEGQAVGMMGNSGRSTGPHLHLEVTRWGSYHDPLDVLGVPVRVDG